MHTTVPRQPDAWHVLARGDFRQPGEVVGPRGIAAVSGVSSDWNLAENAPEADRRKALAELDRRLGQSAHAAGHRQSAVELSLRRGTGADAERLRLSGRLAVAPRAARLAGRSTGPSVRRSGLESQADPTADS